MAERIIVDKMDTHSLLDSPLTIEDMQGLRHSMTCAERGKTKDGLDDAPQLYRLRVGNNSEHGVMVHFPQYGTAVILWLTTRRVIAFALHWREPLIRFFGEDAEIVAGLGIRN